MPYQFVRFALATLLCLSSAAAPVSGERPASEAATRQGRPDRPIVVDCAAGDSLQRSLDLIPGSEQVTIEIRGFCQEAVAITRKVILRGTNASTDGISAPASLGTQTALLAIDGVNGFKSEGFEVVRLERLTITGGPRHGVTVNNAQVGLLDVVISRQAGFGLLAFGGASVMATATTISDNARTGLSSNAGGRIICVDCQITNNGSAGQPAVSSGLAGFVRLNNTTIAGGSGLQAAGGEIHVFGGSIAATLSGASVQSGGSMVFRNNVQVAGSVSCGLQGRIESRKDAGTIGLNQSAIAAGQANQITNGCFFLAGPGATLLAGQTAVGAGAFIVTEGPPAGTSVNFGQLSCFNGGRVTGATIVVNGVQGIPPGC